MCSGGCFGIGGLINLQAHRGVMLKCGDGFETIAQQFFYDFGRLIAAAKPDDLRWRGQ